MRPATVWFRPGGLRVAEASYGVGLSNAWSDEQRRLAAAELMFDPGTFRHLDTIGITAGMRCLELGGGGGSVARWMAQRVGTPGSVLVTDLDVSGLVGCDRPNIEARVHNICTDPLDNGHFDIIHARLLLEHLPPRLTVLDKLVSALRSGGWLLVEDFDFSGIMYLPEERWLCEPEAIRAPLRATVAGSVAIGATSGWDAEFGRDLPLHFVNAGLDRLGSEVCAPLIIGGSPQADFLTLSLRHLGPTYTDAGYLTQPDVDCLIDVLEKPGAMVAGYSMVSAWGRRPV
jgi:SAM-dependent methyltransferase